MRAGVARAPAAAAAILLGLLAACATPVQPRVPLAPSVPGGWTGGPLVRTRFGLVAGRGDEESTWSWKGVPYAAPPVGELRWRAPRDPAPWPGARDASRFGGACTQFDAVTGRVIGGEDCLYLNIWRPRDQAAGLPVYVWIHGGGNSIGSASMIPDYYGHGVAAASRVVFVSVNYRLGPFGWFALPALREGRSAEDDSGNFGTLDLVQALRWVRDNIAASPVAAGLFQRAMVESGVASTTPVAKAESLAERTLRLLLVRDRTAADDQDAARLAASMGPEEIRAYLRSKSDRQIIACYRSWAFGMSDNASLIRDGSVLPADGYRAFETGAGASRVPLVIGSNTEEVKLFQLMDRTLSWREPLYQAAAQLASDRWKADSVDGVARRLAGDPGQPPVYAYQFAWGAPDADGRSVLPGRLGARLGCFHMLEIPFFLGTATRYGAVRWVVGSRANEPGRAALSRAMMAYIAHFIRDGNPNGPGLPRWEPWSSAPGGPKSVVFDAGFTEPRISMSDVEYTRQYALERLRAAYMPSVVEQALARPEMLQADWAE
jgi:para-nitrobenzyl esterase